MDQFAAMRDWKEGAVNQLLFRRKTEGRGIFEVARRARGTWSETGRGKAVREELGSKMFQLVLTKALSRWTRVGLEWLLVQV